MSRRCHYCGRKMIWSKKERSSIERKYNKAKSDGDHVLAEKLKLTRMTFRTKDHVVPRCDGGAKTKENIVDACMQCNVEKGSMSYSDFLYISRFGPKLCHEPVRLMLAETLGVTVEDLKTKKQKKREARKRERLALTASVSMV